MITLKQATFSDESFMFIFDWIIAQFQVIRGTKTLNYFDKIQSCQPEFKDKFLKYLDNKTNLLLSIGDPFSQVDDWTIVENHAEVLAHLYSYGFFDLDLLEKFTIEILKPYEEHFRYTCIAILITVLHTCWKRLKVEKTSLYIKLLDIAHHYCYTLLIPEEVSNKLKKNYQKKYPGQELPYLKMSQEVLEAFNEICPTDPKAGNPRPCIKLYLLKSLGRELPFEVDFVNNKDMELKKNDYEESAKFFNFYSPNAEMTFLKQ